MLSFASAMKFELVYSEWRRLGSVIKYCLARHQKRYLDEFLSIFTRKRK
jgi:hypothetical protein